MKTVIPPQISYMLRIFLLAGHHGLNYLIRMQMASPTTRSLDRPALLWGRSPCGLHLELSPHSFTSSLTHSIAPFRPSLAALRLSPSTKTPMLFLIGRNTHSCEKSDFQSARLHPRVKGAQAKGVAPRRGFLRSQESQWQSSAFLHLSFGAPFVTKADPWKLQNYSLVCCLFLLLFVYIVYIVIYIIIIYLFIKYI